MALLLSGPAWSGHLEDARAAERAGDHAGEHAACTALLAGSTGGAGAEACRRRIAWLEARRDADGSFTSLDALQAVRRERRTLDAEVAWARVEAIAGAPSAPARVQDEAALWLGREALDRRDAPVLALSWTTPLWSRLAPERGRPGGLRAQVADLHARALLGSGDEAGAAAVEAAARPVRSAVPREGLPLALRAQRREHARNGAWAGLAIFALAAGPPAARTWARPDRPRPRGLLPLLLVGVGAAGLVALWDTSLAPAVLLLVASLAGVHLVAAGALAGTRPGPLRMAQRGVAAMGTLAAAWLVADRLGLAAQVGL
jgi:hypothetical protein